jgi:toxin CcdB
LVKGLQFEVYRVVGLRAGSAVDLAIVVQNATLSHLATRLVAPLVEIEAGAAADKMTPQVEIGGVRYMIATHLLTTIPLRNLGSLVASLQAEERTIKNAIDFVFFGV